MRTSLIIIALLGATNPLQAEPVLQVSAAATYDNNVNNGSIAADRKADTVAAVQLKAGRIFDLPADASLSLAGTLDTQKFLRFDGLDHTSVGALASYSYKLGLGRDVPRIIFSTSAAHASYRNAIRDGWLYQGTMGIGKRWSERWTSQLTYLFDRVDTDSNSAEVPNLSGAAFNQIAHSIAVDSTYFYSATTALTFAYTRRSGDVTATTRPGPGIYRVSSALAEDDVFGDEFYAYRLRALSQDFSVALSEGVSDRSSVNLRYQRRLSNGRGDFNYYNSMLNASWLYSY